MLKANFVLVFHSATLYRKPGQVDQIVILFDRNLFTFIILFILFSRESRCLLEEKNTDR